MTCTVAFGAGLRDALLIAGMSLPEVAELLGLADQNLLVAMER